MLILAPPDASAAWDHWGPWGSGESAGSSSCRSWRVWGYSLAPDTLQWLSRSAHAYPGRSDACPGAAAGTWGGRLAWFLCWWPARWCQGWCSGSDGSVTSRWSAARAAWSCVGWFWRSGSIRGVCWWLTLRECVCVRMPVWDKKTNERGHKGRKKSCILL